MRLTIAVLSLSLAGGAIAQTPKFNQTDIGALLGTNSVAQAINARADVVGYWVRDIGPAAFLYRSNQVYEIAALGTNANFAMAINVSGYVVGHSMTDDGLRAFFFNGTNTWPLDWGGTNSYGTGINASNQIVGFTETSNGVTAVFFDGQTWDIGNLGGTTTYAYGLNASNQIVGSSATTNGDFHAFVVVGGVMQDLNAVAQSAGLTLTAARAINASGIIAGWGITNGALQAFQLNGTNLAVIPLLQGATNGYASAINNSSSVVGACGTTNGLRAFLWQNGVLSDLNDRIATNSGWVLREANGINDSGQIVGWGNINGEVHAFLLTPNQAPTVSITSSSECIMPCAGGERS